MGKQKIRLIILRPSHRTFALSLKLPIFAFLKKMDITGKIIKVLAPQSGEGKNGTWRSQDFILQTEEQYPKKVCINLFGNKIDQFALALNDKVKVSFDIESREWNDRWFTTIRAWKVEKVSENTISENDSYSHTNHAPFPSEISPQENDLPIAGNDLPF